MKKLLALAFCSLASSGCLRHLDEIVLDPELPPDLAEATIEGSASWCNAVGGSACVPVRVGLPSNVRSAGEGGCSVPGRFGETSLSPLEPPTITYCFPSWVLPEKVRSTAAHELGHALSGTGAHIPEPGFVMSASAAPIPITPEDVAFFLSVRNELAAK